MDFLLLHLTAKDVKQHVIVPLIPVYQFSSPKNLNWMRGFVINHSNPMLLSLMFSRIVRSPLSVTVQSQNLRFQLVGNSHFDERFYLSDFTNAVVLLSVWFGSSCC